MMTIRTLITDLVEKNRKKKEEIEKERITKEINEIDEYREVYQTYHRILKSHNQRYVDSSETKVTLAMAGYSSPYQKSFNRSDPFNSIARNVIGLSKYEEERNKKWALWDTQKEFSYSLEKIERMIEDYPKMIEKEKALRKKAEMYSIKGVSEQKDKSTDDIARDSFKDDETELINRYYQQDRN